MLTFKQFIKEQDKIEETALAARVQAGIVGAARRMTTHISDVEGKRFKNMDDWHKNSVETKIGGGDTSLARIHAHVDKYAHRQKLHHPGDSNSPLIQYLKSKGHKIIKKMGGNRGEHFATNFQLIGDKPKPKRKFKMKVHSGK
jgi:hypothetical protein